MANKINEFKGSVNTSRVAEIEKLMLQSQDPDADLTIKTVEE